MGATKVFRHAGYELRCSALAVDSGRFVPAVVVSKQGWPRRPRNIAIERGDCLSVETAIDAARAQGIAWIINFG